MAAQQRDPDSFLNWLERMTRLRTRSPEFGVGRCDWLETGDPAVLAHCCQGEHSNVLAIHNLSDREVNVSINLDRKIAGVFDVLKNSEYPFSKDGRLRFRLEPYAYRWLREGRDPESLGGVID